jgi:hypothetical protein
MAKRRQSGPGAIGWLLLLFLGALAITILLTPTLGGSTAADVGVYGMIGPGIVIGARNLRRAAQSPGGRPTRVEFSASIIPPHSVPFRADLRSGSDNPGEIFPPQGVGGIDVVGESYHRAAIEGAIGGRRHADGVRVTVDACLVWERGNSHDPNAVAVNIGHEVCGYLSRGNAAAYRPCVARVEATGLALMVRADVNGGFRRDDGGWANYGIRVYLEEPHQLSEWLDKHLPGGLPTLAGEHVARSVRPHTRP